MNHDDIAAPHQLDQRLARNRLSRRDTLWLFAAASSLGGLSSGCSTSPVTGKKILVGMSRADERAVDKEHAPHQFSADLGVVQDAAVNNYVADVLQRLLPQAQRQDVSFSARVLNANYVNAYTFPAGTMGVTRGIMLEMEDEAQLAALLGHEMGHVNARHSAQSQGKELITTAALFGLSVALSDSKWSPLIDLGGQIGASALLARYSRSHEREADALGQKYMVAAGYPAQGMTQLHELLLATEKGKPNILETMFSSHPLSQERRDTAARLAETAYAESLSRPNGRERYMDSTAGLRRLQPAVLACQNGETALSRKQLPEAERQFAAALRHTPTDYAANLRMAQCQHAMGKLAEARRYAQTAREIYPQEAQAVKLTASVRLAQNDPAGALADLQQFDRLLPGDAGAVFLKGVANEGLGQRQAAGKYFAQYLKSEADDPAAKYAKKRLADWGMKP
jgi:predicted Zn-dependent protease